MKTRSFITRFNLFLALICYIFCLSKCTNTEPVKQENEKIEWKILFDGNSLEGWTPKFTKNTLAENYLNTFTVNNGAIVANYAEYDSFRYEFGHLFYNEPFRNYHLSLEYRFFGEQSDGGPEWAFRNSGVMFHSQDPKTMELDQDFPVCLEFQFLGGNGEEERSTGNLCTPNSHVEIDGKLVKDHCIPSNSKTFHGDDWVLAELIVFDNKIIHLIEGDTVMQYSNPIIDSDGISQNLGLTDGEPMTRGYIALQAESHPVAFKNIKIRELK